MKKGIAAVALLLSSPALAQQNPIDLALAQCLNDATSTVAMVSCYDRASQAWDREMNIHYNQLINSLSGEPATALRRTQRQWLAYRDSWQAASRAFFTRTQGSMAQIAVAGQGVDLVRNQALMLQSLNKGSCASNGDC
ncbi:lysozyme inhibitor LprI family protein [Pantoea sp. KPR_PJ]|uniref:lysozyme inhibitor LprI family protein n=1 Tax=Pantoea sp. KPR_PJ TaxID=2738375 RepID=UPI0035278A55